MSKSKKGRQGRCSKKGSKPPKSRAQADDGLITVQARRLAMTVVVLLTFDEVGEVVHNVQEAPNGRDPQAVDMGEAFAFYFANRYELHVMGEGDEEVTVYGMDGVKEEGPLFYRGECQFGSAAYFLAEFPGDLDLVNLIGGMSKKKGERLVMVPAPFAANGVTRHYRARGKEDRILTSSATKVPISESSTGGEEEGLVQGCGLGGFVN